MDDDVARAHVLPAPADVRAAAKRLPDRHCFETAIRQLDLHDGVRPRGNERAGHDAHGRPWLQRARGRMPRGDVADHGQRDRSVLDVFRAHGIAVHGAIVGGRVVARSDDVFTQDSTMSLRERNEFRFTGDDLGQHSFLRVLDLQHCGRSFHYSLPLF